MTIAHFDTFSGAAGDMIQAALIDAGLPLAILTDTVARLRLAGVTLRPERVQRHGLMATQLHVDVDAAEPQPHRHLRHIVEIIDAADLPPIVATNAKRIFEHLATAEAAVHGTTIEKVHFHEVGAVDAIVDIVGACAGLHHLGVERVTCSPIPTGHGTVRCEHGLMPVPAPATAELLRGVPLAACDEPGELITPTGAAILTTLATDFGPPPPMTVTSVGTGTGTREGRTRPNILRVLLGTADSTAAGEADAVTVLETQVDDATGQAVAYALDRALEAGALDAFTTPIGMKKGRPGQLLTVLCRPADVPAIEDVLFAETTTLGIRRYDARRTILARASATVTTEFGPVRVKLGRRGESIVQAWPEYEDCAAIARERGVPLRRVQAAALQAWQQAGSAEAQT